MYQIPDCSHPSRISMVLFSFYQNEKIRFAQQFVSILGKVFNALLYQETEILKCSSNSNELEFECTHYQIVDIPA